MDNLEWATGFSERFGLFYVNHSDPKLPRVAKTSVALYSTIISCNGFPDPALGPHECLNTEPEGKAVHPLKFRCRISQEFYNICRFVHMAYNNLCVYFTATKQPEIDSNNTVSFLGMTLSTSEAETGLTTTFALLIVAVFGVICSSFCLFKAKKRSKKLYEESIKLENKF